MRKIYLEMLRAAPKGAVLRVVRDEFKWTRDWEFLRSEEWKRRTRRLQTEQSI